MVQDSFSPERFAVVDHFKDYNTRLPDGRFMVPLPRIAGTKPLSESHSQAVCRFLSFKWSLHFKGLFHEFKAVIDEYFRMGQSEPVPAVGMEKHPHSVYYLLMHDVMKQSSTATRVQAVFDASAKT